MPNRLRVFRDRVRHGLRSWQLPALVGAVVLVGLLWWLSPWKVDVRITTRWDATNLYRAAAFWWLWLVLGAALAVILAARKLAGRRVLSKAWGARFFLGSVLAHAVLLLLLGWWTLPRIVEVMVSRPQVEPLPDVHNDQQQPGEDGRRAFEKVADLTETDPAPGDDIVRADAPPPAAPDAVGNLAPTISPAAARALPPERVLYVAPREAPAPAPTQELRPLERRAALPTVVLRELQETVEPPPAAAAAPEEPPVESQVVLSRDALPAPQEHAPGLPQRRVELATQRPLAVEMETVDAAEEPSVDQVPQLAGLTRQALPVLRQPAQVVETAEVPAAAADAEQMAEIAPPDEGRAPDRRQIAGPVPTTLPARRPDLNEMAATLLPQSTGRRPAPFEEEPSVSSRVVPQLARAVPAPARVADSLPGEEPPEIRVAVAERPRETQVDATTATLAPTTARPIDPSNPLPRTPSLPRRVVAPAAAALADDDSPTPEADLPTLRLDRTRPGTGRVALAEDRADLPSMFVLRDEETRRQYIELFGGTAATEESVNRGLEWLAKHQNPEGSWSLHRFHVPEGESPNIPGAGHERSDTAATGLALLAFLGGRHTHQSGRYQKVVAGGVKWLTDHQKEDGELRGEGDNQRMYSHGIAAIALCEAYGISRDPGLREPARKALEFIAKAQHGEGGWRYNPGESGDTSVVGWQMMALKSGEMAGLDVPPETMERLRQYLARVEGNKPVGGQFGYQGPHPTPAMTGEGLLCLQFLGEDRDSPRMRAGADYLLKHLPDPAQSGTSYYWYYATQVMYHMQGEYWETWNPLARDLLVGTQIKEGPLAGTWDPRDQWEQKGGRLYATAVKLLMLEVYYRHLPLYEQLDD